MSCTAVTTVPFYFSEMCVYLRVFNKRQDEDFLCFGFDSRQHTRRHFNMNTGRVNIIASKYDDRWQHVNKVFCTAVARAAA